MTANQLSVTMPAQAIDALSQVAVHLDPRHSEELKKPLAVLLNSLVMHAVGQVLHAVIPPVIASLTTKIDKRVIELSSQLSAQIVAQSMPGILAELDKRMKAEFESQPIHAAQQKQSEPLEVKIVGLPSQAVKTELTFDKSGKVTGKVERPVPNWMS